MPSARPPARVLRAALDVEPLRNALVATTLTNPLLTHRLLTMLVADSAAVTPERVRMLQQPFVVEGATERLGEWLVPFATTHEASLATERWRYTRLTIPTLVLWGARDAITPVDQGRDIARLIHGSRWVELPSAGHIPAIEDPTGFDAALVSFLDSTARPAHSRGRSRN